MLDDLKYIHQKDVQDALGITGKQWQQLEHVIDLLDWSLDSNTITNIVYAGMGGSALAASLSLSWPGYSLPFQIVRGYELPKYVSSTTLCIVSSYSGNTEEEVAMLKQAEAKQARIVVITSGGELEVVAKEKGYPLALLPQGYQPRHATLYNLKALVVILERAGLVSEASAEQALKETAVFLRAASQNWGPEIATEKNKAKQIALECVGKSPVIYAGPKLFPAAYKWKISFNENAKNVAWCNEYPEFCHNELIGWSSHPMDKPYTIIDLRSTFEHERVNKRFVITDKLLSGKRPAAIVIEAEGATMLEQLLWAVTLGDHVSIYLALLSSLKN
jgi:glucose/mannose-6-phosphate isomerase